MNGSRRRFSLAGLSAAVGIIGLAGCANPQRIAAPPVPPPAPEVRVGDRWRYAVINLYNGVRIGEVAMRVVEVTPRLRVEVTDASGQALPPEIHASPWNVIQEPAYDQVQVFTEPCPLLPRVLEPGAREDWQGTYRVPGDDWLHYWSVRVDARDWERVRVPAGVFEALRVTRRIAFRHSDLHRVESVRNETLWYAPQVKRWVRREWTGSYRVPGYPPNRRGEDWVAWELLA